MNQRDALEEWRKFLLAESHLLRRNPCLLFQQAANRVRTSAPAGAALHRSEAGLEKRPWMRRVNTPRHHSSCLLTLRGHTEWTDRCAVSPDGTRILSRSSAEVILWDVETGEELARIDAGRCPRDPEADGDGEARRSWAFGFEMAEAFFTPDGRFILTIDRGLRLRAWDAWTGAPLATLSPGEPERSLSRTWAFSPHRPEIVCGLANGTLLHWDWKAGTARILAGHVGPITSCAFSPDGRRILSASADKTLRSWDAATGSLRVSLAAHSDGVIAGAFSPDGNSVLSISRDGTFRIWAAATGAEREAVMLSEGTEEPGLGDWTISPDGARIAVGSIHHRGDLCLIDAVAGRLLSRLKDQIHDDCVFSPDGLVLATVDYAEIALWDGRTGAHKGTLTGHTEKVDRVAFSPDGLRIVSASEDETLRIWDPATCACLATLVGHTGWVYDVAWHPNGDRIVSAATDREVRIWDIKTAEREVLTGHVRPVGACAFSPDGARIVSGSKDSTLKVWDAATGAEMATLAGHEDDVGACAFSPDGTMIASASRDRIVRLWDAQTGAPRAVLGGHPSTVASCVFSPDGTRLLSGDFEGLMMIWDVAARTRLITMEGHQNSINLCCFSPDGRQVASASDDGTLRIWDAGTGAELALLRGAISDGSARDVCRCVYAPDGSRLLSVSRDGAVRLWDTTSMVEAVTIAGHPDVWLYCAAYSPDGRYIASGGNDDMLKIWESATGREMVTIAGHDDSVFWCAFSPDGRRLLSASNDGTVGLWSVPDGGEIGRYAPGEGNLLPAWSPAGLSLAVGPDIGTIHVVFLENFALAPPVVTAWRSPGDRTMAMGCPLCRGWSVLEPDTPGREIACPACRRTISLNSFLIEADWRPVALAWRGAL